MGYRQLTQEQRYQIGAYIRIGMKRSEIARRVGVHRSTVWREIRRNSTSYRYNPSRAVRLARERHEGKRKRGVDSETWRRVEGQLSLGWSPEQISERLRVEGLPAVSHETIYRRIYQNKQEGGDLYIFLRRRHK